VDTLDDLVGMAFDEEAVVEFRVMIDPIAPSCRRVNESSFGLVVLEGRGGGDRLP
jgi:hypothetical protein